MLPAEPLRLLQVGKDLTLLLKTKEGVFVIKRRPRQLPLFVQQLSLAPLFVWGQSVVVMPCQGDFSPLVG